MSIAELRSTLHRAPSAQTWEALCALCDTLPHDAVTLDEQLLPYAQSLLMRWPDALRVMPPRWSEALHQGGAAPFAPLARTLDHVVPPLPREALRLLHHPALASITRLDLSIQPDLWHLIPLLAQASFAARLVHLDLSRHLLHGIGLVMFLDHQDAFPALRELALRHTALRAQTSQHDDVLHAFLVSPLCQKLELLDLSGNVLSRALGEAAGRITNHYKSLHTLSLSKCELHDASLPLLSTWFARAPRLSRLDLSHNALADSALGALFAPLTDAPLTALDLRGNHAGRHTFEALSHLPALHTLSLSTSARQDARHAEIEHLAAPLLRRLILEGELTWPLIERLADATHLPTLEEVRLILPADTHPDTLATRLFACQATRPLTLELVGLDLPADREHIRQSLAAHPCWRLRFA